MIRPAATCLLVLSLFYVGFEQLTLARGRILAPRLAVVATPAGTGFEANVSSALIPDQHRGRYQLIPIAELVNASRSEDETPDAGVDGGVTDPKEATAEAAREAALAFDLVRAAELWRKAADEVLSSETVAMNLQLAATYLLEAGAASAAAGEADLARTYFRRSLSIDLDIEPGPEISPDAKVLFREARKKGPSLFEIPRDATLEMICDELGTSGLVWIAVGTDEDSLVVSFKVFQKGGETSELETRQYSLTSDGVAPQWIESEQKRLDAAIAYKLFGKPVTIDIVQKAPPEIKRPWYKKWWFYTVVGGVVAAGAAGLTSYFLLREEKADILVHL